MNAIREISLKQPSRRAAVALMFVGLAVATLAVVAEQPEATSPDASAEAVAREILEIQKELGGSIVPSLSYQPPHPRADSPQRIMVTTETRIDHLRDTAWRLDSASHRLECNDLYSQADALRALASRLRQDARDIKGQSTKSE